MENIRLFIGFNFSEEFIKKLSFSILKIKREIPENEIRWVPYNKIHITLAFLGDKPQSDINSVISAIKQTAQICPPCSAVINKLGAFPSFEKLRILWIGVRPDRSMIDLSQILFKNLNHTNIIYDKKPFVPHLTIGRFSDRMNPETKKIISEQLKSLNLDFNVEEKFSSIFLFQSIMQSNSYYYKKILSLPLKNY